MGQLKKFFWKTGWRNRRHRVIYKRAELRSNRAYATLRSHQSKGRNLVWENGRKLLIYKRADFQPDLGKTRIPNGATMCGSRNGMAILATIPESKVFSVKVSRGLAVTTGVKAAMVMNQRQTAADGR
ncbi:MAG: hypothetical protein WCB12_16270 [Bryobacteraceae bacterium]